MTGKTCWRLLFRRSNARLTDKLHTSFISYRTSQYQLHYYETPTNIKFVMLTDVRSPSMRIALQQIYINLFVEYGVWDSLFRFDEDIDQC